MCVGIVHKLPLSDLSIMVSVAATLFLAMSPMAFAVAPFRVSLMVANLENGANGKIVLEVHPEWAPKAAERFSKLLEQDFLNGLSFFKVVPGSSAHFGVSTNPSLSAQWRDKTPLDDFKKEENQRGRVSFVTDDGQLTEMVISTKDNDHFDRKGYVPFAEVVDGIFFIDRVTSIYGSKPEPSRIEKEGDVYLQKEFPKLSYIESVELVEQQPDLHLPFNAQVGVTRNGSLLAGFGISIALAVLWYRVMNRGSDTMSV